MVIEMKFLKETLENPLMKKLTIGMGLFIFIIIFLLIIASCSTSTRTYTYPELEQLITEKVMTKYQNSDMLPKQNSTLEINIEDLVNNGELKALNEYTNTTDSCTAKVTIYNNNDYYLYIPNIDCGDTYKTTTLYNTLLNDSLTTAGNGLYAENNEYIFKGDKANNFVQIENTLYRVININEDSTIKLMEYKNKKNTQLYTWDDRFNIDKNMNTGINNYYTNNINSRIKDSLEELYNSSEYFTDTEKAYFIPTEFCVGKRSINELDNSSAIECSVKTEKYPIGLLALYEYFNATLDTNCKNITDDSCTNYNFLSDDTASGSIWTLTADKDTSNKVFKIASAKPNLYNASTTAKIKIVVNVNKDLLVEQGDGTLDNPYIIKSMI